MKLSKDQKDELARELSVPWGRVELLCDGYLVSLCVERFKGITYRVMTYVNGRYSWAWCNPKDEAPEIKFLRKSVRPNVSPVKRKKLEKELGKRYIQNHKFWNGSVTLYLPDWASGKAALNHLCKVCESVQLSKKGDALSELLRVGEVNVAFEETD